MNRPADCDRQHVNGGGSKRNDPTKRAAARRAIAATGRAPRNMIEALLLGADSNFEFNTSADFPSTDALPGSSEKLEVLRRRVELGLPLWHDNDRRNYERFGSDDE